MRHSQHTATLGALNAELRLPIKGMGGARIDIRGTFTATLVFEGTQNGTDWISVQNQNSGTIQNGALPNNGTSAVGSYVTADLTGFTEFRIRVSSYTSGSAVIVLSLTEESQIDQVGIVGGVVNNDNIWYQESVTPQAIGATVTGTSRDLGVAQATTAHYSAFNVFAFADQVGTVRIEVSNDNATWRKASADQAVTAGQGIFLTVPVVARYFRAVYVNGAAAQGAFMLNTSFTAA